MKTKRAVSVVSFAVAMFAMSGGMVLADNTMTKIVTECHESRQDATPVTRRDIKKGWPNVQCSQDSGGVLWWGDPFDGTIPMGDMSVEADYSHEEAVVKPREPYLDRNKMFSICTEACHNDSYQKPPESIKPRLLKMHTDIVPNSLQLKHGRGAVWCLNCHNANDRSTLVDNFGEKISFNQPQKLCGKCHGPILRDWRDGIHGKRIGMWDKGGKKRWWVCTECHNPHDIQQGNRNSGFAQLPPEMAPELPKGMPNKDHDTYTHSH